MSDEEGRDSAIEATKKRLLKLTKGLTSSPSDDVVKFLDPTYRPSAIDFRFRNSYCLRVACWGFRGRALKRGAGGRCISIF